MKWKSVNQVWDDKRNVCEFCKRETKTYYIVTGHDHTDESMNLCDCGKGLNPKTIFNNNPWARDVCPDFDKVINETSSS